MDTGCYYGGLNRIFPLIKVKGQCSLLYAHTLLSVNIVIVPRRHSHTHAMRKRWTTVNEYDLNE